MTHSYFKPRRRKLGVMMLMMACALMVMRIRSCLISDFFEKGNVGENSIVIENSNGVFGVMTNVCYPHSKPSASKPYRAWSTETIGATGGLSNTFRGIRKHERFKFSGCAEYWWKADTNLGPRTFHLVEIDWLVMIFPLTLLSVWLLLSKPRVKKIESIELATKTEP